ncbi:MAG: HD domain-containing protein [Armatimonadia bacterium]
MSIVRTYSGRSVSLASPDPASIDIRDIACGLSRLNRFNGATKLPVSVADHSLNVARLLGMWKADAELQLLGLLHDAHEAYFGDITTPVRRELAAWAGADHVQRMADRLDRAIFQAFRLNSIATSFAHAKVRDADAAVYAAEWRDLMPGPCPMPVAPASFPIKPRNADKAEEEFLKTFDRLRLDAGTDLLTSTTKMLTPPTDFVDQES